MKSPPDKGRAWVLSNDKKALLESMVDVAVCAAADDQASTVHDADYRTAWKDWESFVESLTEKIIEKDDTIPELPPKDLV